MPVKSFRNDTLSGRGFKAFGVLIENLRPSRIIGDFCEVFEQIKRNAFRASAIRQSVDVNCISHSAFLSVGGVGSPTVATGGGAASLSAASPALCTTCDARLDDTAIRACSVRDCPHAQQEAA